MPKSALPILLAASLAISAPARAETDLGKILSGFAQSLIVQQSDRSVYLEAQRLNTARGYRNYLAKFPNGAYRGNAQQALVRLGVSGETDNPPPTAGGSHSAATVEAAIGLSRTQRVLIQKQLTSIGYSTGVADGLWGTNTRSAVARWQTANKELATGYVTARQVGLIGRQAGSRVGTDPGGTVIGDDPVEERLLGLTYYERREVQTRLTGLGYNTRGVDGSFGPNTRQALASWQRDAGMRASGYLTADQLRTLRRDTGA